MNRWSRKPQLALAALVLLLAVARLLMDRNGAGGAWTVVAGIAIGLVLLVFVVMFAVRLTKRGRVRTLPVVNDVRREGATAFMCSKDMDPEYLVVSIGAGKDLTVSRVEKGSAVPWLRLGASTYQLSHLAAGTSAPRLQVQSPGQSFQLNVMPDEAMALRPTPAQRAEMGAAIEQLIAASH